MATTDLTHLAKAVEQLEKLRKIEDFDPLRPCSRPTKAQQEVIDDFGIIPIQWIVSSNRGGKSALAARILSWILTDTHPNWKRPKEWGQSPITAIVCARTGKQIEGAILPKLMAQLNPEEYTRVSTNHATQRIEFTNGNCIIFQSLENPRIARERLQGYTAHFVWIDEMPSTLDIASELIMRVQADGGYFIATFTPLIYNIALQKMVEASSPPHSKQYSLHIFDNPQYASKEKQEEVLKSLEHLPEAIREARLNGKWITVENTVYQFDYSTMVADVPDNYSSGWRHVESVDPASESATGYTLWAEDPDTGVWYCLVSEYIHSKVPEVLVAEILSKTRGLNIVRRVSDVAPWFSNTALSHGTVYLQPFSKTTRKEELIKQAQQYLYDSKIKLTPSGSQPLIDELLECRWSENMAGRVVNGQKYHCKDSMEYFCDLIPAREPGKRVVTSSNWAKWLRETDDARLLRKAESRDRLSKKWRKAWD